MPDKASTAGAPPASEATQPASRRPSARTRGGRGATDDRPGTKMPLQTLAQAMGADGYHPNAGDLDGERMTRSYHLSVGVVEMARATSVGVEHKAYGTPIEDQVPHSVSAFVEECIRAGIKYYEDLFNDGKPFRRTGPLSPGPTREGAQRGAAKRRLAKEQAAAAQAGATEVDA
jgi:hypothetical protein